MALVVATHDLFGRHDTGRGHPERADRLGAVRRGIEQARLDEAVVWVEATDAPAVDLERVHPATVLARLAKFCSDGGGPIDPDTHVSAESYRAAVKAAGAGLDLIAALEDGRGDVGWSVVRPPGHHALGDRQMGFCLINNIAVAARHLADRGERVAIVDIDAHHGNGTQDLFYDDPDVLFVSLHQYPWYPYTGGPEEVGTGEGVGATVNVPLPAGTTGDTYRTAIDEVIGPVLERHQPTWLLISAGFDGHRADPITDLGLSSADYADMVAELLALVPAGRRILFLEGGYDLDALRNCAAAVSASAVGLSHRPEKPTAGGPGDEHVALARRIHFEEGPATR